MDIDMAILNRRLTLGITQTAFAAIVGVTQRQVSEWERGIYKPLKLNRFALIHKAGLDPRYLVENWVALPHTCGGVAA